MMRMRAACAVMVALGGLGAVGCTPPATGGGTPKTTTTTLGLTNPAAGCYDSSQSTGSDVLYSGTPNVVGNLHGITSKDGSCSGSVASTNGILVLAEGEPQANAACFALGRSAAYEPVSVGIAMPSSAWFCTSS